jgi:hypothetical protein
MRGFEYTIAAHPTTYNGVNFRSRLEARWAAFFDLNGWEWSYEPVDLDGWSPDFLLDGHLVEIKPFVKVASQSLIERAMLLSRRLNVPVALCGVAPSFSEELPTTYVQYSTVLGVECDCTVRIPYEPVAQYFPLWTPNAGNECPWLQSRRWVEAGNLTQKRYR